MKYLKSMYMFNTILLIFDLVEMKCTKIENKYLINFIIIFK